MSERVTVTIGSDGKVQVEAHGVVGQGCEALTRPLEEALGTRGPQTRKPEYFATQAQGQQASQQ